MPHFMIVFVLYINLLNISLIKEYLFLRNNYGAFKSILQIPNFHPRFQCFINNNNNIIIIIIIKINT